MSGSTEMLPVGKRMQKLHQPTSSDKYILRINFFQAKQAVKLYRLYKHAGGDTIPGH
jgi:hypothetical protein